MQPIILRFKRLWFVACQLLPDGYLHHEAKNIIRYEYFLCAWFLLKGLHNADYLYLIGCWKKCCHNEFILYDGTCLNILEKWISNGDNSIFISIWIFDIYEMKWQNWYLIFIRMLFSFYVMINVYLVCWFSSILPFTEASWM